MKGDDIASRLVAYGAAITRLVGALPIDPARRHIADQLFRSATSAGANYAEARSARSRRDFAHKVSLAAKEMRESAYWLGVLDKAGLAGGQDLAPIAREGDELIAILMASAKTASRGGTRIGNQREKQG